MAQFQNYMKLIFLNHVMFRSKKDVETSVQHMWWAKNPQKRRPSDISQTLWNVVISQQDIVVNRYEKKKKTEV